MPRPATSLGPRPRKLTSKPRRADTPTDNKVTRDYAYDRAVQATVTQSKQEERIRQRVERIQRSARGYR